MHAAAVVHAAVRGHVRADAGAAGCAVRRRADAGAAGRAAAGHAAAGRAVAVMTRATASY